MAKQKSSKSDEKTQLEAGFYKGYDISWLRNNEDHPDYHLVAEHDKIVKKED